MRMGYPFLGLRGGGSHRSLRQKWCERACGDIRDKIAEIIYMDDLSANGSPLYLRLGDFHDDRILNGVAELGGAGSAGQVGGHG